MTEIPQSHRLLPKPLDELLAEVHSQMNPGLSAQGRMHSLLQAVLDIGGDLDLATVLRRLTEASLLDRYV
jgi:hypothetical protein